MNRRLLVYPIAAVVLLLGSVLFANSQNEGITTQTAAEAMERQGKTDGTSHEGSQKQLERIDDDVDHPSGQPEPRESKGSEKQLEPIDDDVDHPSDQPEPRESTTTNIQETSGSGSESRDNPGDHD